MLQEELISKAEKEVQPQGLCETNQTLSMCDLSCQALNINHITLTKHDEKNLKPDSPPLVSTAVNHFPPVHSFAGRNVPCQGCSPAGMKMQCRILKKRQKSYFLMCISFFLLPLHNLLSKIHNLKAMWA